MQRIAQFYKVSYEEFKTGIVGEIPGIKEEEIKEMYDTLQLPKRATKGSAGYDFYTPFTFHLKPGETIKIPTGIRVKMEMDSDSNIVYSSITQWESLTVIIIFLIMKDIFLRRLPMIPMKAGK